MTRHYNYTLEDPKERLSDALNLMSAEYLKKMVAYLSPPGPRPTRKADMAECIKQHLTTERLRRIWDNLDRIGRLAVQEVLHSSNNRFNPRQFEARYGCLPARLTFGYGSSGKAPLPIRFFLYFTQRDETGSLVIPEDIAESLRTFVPKPKPPTVASHDELPQQSGQPKLIVRDMEQAAAHDLFAVMRLIDLGRISVGAKTHRPSKAAMTHIAKELHGGDFFDPGGETNSWGQTIGPIRAFAWPHLMQAGGLAKATGSKLGLTRAGRAALGKPAAETLKHLWDRWLESPILDEFSRVDCIKGQHRGKGKRAMTDAEDRRIEIENGLTGCPVGQWVDFDKFSRFMRAEGLEFEVTDDPWTLYIEETHYGSLGYSDCHGWNILQERYMRCVLFEYAASLGMIDVAYCDPDKGRKDFGHLWGASELPFLSRYDGLHYIRLTGLGAYCLGMADKYEPTALSVQSSISIFPDLQVRADTPLAADEKLTLEMYAQVESEGIWRLDRGKVLDKLESGHSIDSLREFLSARDSQPFPETVEGFLRGVESAAHALTEKGAAILIECADEKVADTLASDARVSKLCLRAGNTHLVVPSRKEPQFRKAVRKLGFGLPRA